MNPVKGWSHLRQSVFFIKLLNWEYWPMWIANLPVIFIWLWFSLRARHLFFFSAVNPAIETGGVLGESKINILRRIPESVLPVTVFVPRGRSFASVLDEMKQKGLLFPVIAKPNVGERGLLVTKIESEAQLRQYFRTNKIDFLIQEFVDLPFEWAVMHHRMPDTGEGRVTSVCIKAPLKVIGDGTSTIRDLMTTNPRALLQLERFEKTAPDLLRQIPPKGEIVELEPIGNHCRGTKFLNGNHLIDEELHAVFNRIAAQMEGIYYGRFDMKCASVEAVRKGQFKVLEYNGIAAEPAHIYDPAYPLLKKYRDIYRHWKIIFDIYKIQRRRGEKGMTLREALTSFRNYRRYMAQVGG